MKVFRYFFPVIAFSILSLEDVSAGLVDYTGLEDVFGESVTTSATGKPQRVSETPVSMEIISSEEISRSGAMDIPQLLQRYAGVDVRRNFKGHADVSVRGFNQPFSNRLLVLINGRQIYMDNYGMTLWHSLPIQMSEIKQIEIVRGPNTSLFGFNAASGVINIITFNPIYDEVNNFEGRMGTQNFRETSGVATIKATDNFSVRASAGGILSDDFSKRSLSSSLDKDNAIEKRAANIDSAWKISEKTALRVETGFNNQETDSLYPYYLYLKTDTVTRHITSNFSHDSENFGLWNFRVYRNELDFNNSVEQDNRLNVFQLSNLISLNSQHTIRLGAEYRDNSLSGPSVGTGDAEFSMNIYSASGMWDWQLHDNLSLTNSARIDYWESDRKGGFLTNDTFLNLTPSDYEQNNTEFSFNTGFLYKASSDSSYRLSIARGLHIPSLDELALDIGTVDGADFYGNPNLDTEATTLIELGYSRNLSQYNMTVGANLFYEEIDNVIAATVRPPSILGGNGGVEADFTFENVGDASAYGLEFISKGKLLNDKLFWHANYTYLLTQDKPSGLADHYIDFSNTQPKHKANLTIGYTQDAWEFDTSLHYVASNDYQATVADVIAPRVTSDLESYFTVNARLGYRIFDNTTISLDGYNLLDEHHEIPSYRYSLGAGSDFGGGIEIGRAGFITLRHRF